MQGAYFYNALSSLAPILVAFPDKNAKPLDYIKEPLPLSKAEFNKREKRDERIAMEQNKKKMIAIMNANNKRFKNKK